MIVIMQMGATKAQVATVAESVKAMNLGAHIIEGEERTIVAVVGEDRSAMDREALSALDGVERIMPVLTPYKLASRDVHPDKMTIPYDGKSIGGEKVIVIAGPHIVDDPEQFLATAKALKTAGADGIIGNIFGVGLSPYASQGVGEAGLDLLAEVRRVVGLPILSEVTDPRMVKPVAKVADMLLVSGHHMQNFPLLNEVGDSKQTTLLKRGLFNTMEELLMAAEYILARGNRNVILCEGGIRITEGFTGNVTFDINAVPVLRGKTYLPLMVDVSRAAGMRAFVPSIARGAIAAGVDGLLVEVDTRAVPETADNVDDEAAYPGLTIEAFAALRQNLGRLAHAVERTI